MKRVTVIGEPELSVDLHKHDPNVMLSVALVRVPSEDNEQGHGFQFIARVQNGLTTLDQLTLVEALIQQLTDVRNTLANGSAKGIRS